jgi:inositol-pentakisphosphate 2-kinase
MNSDLLARLRQLQSSLDPLDIEGLWQLLCSQRNSAGESTSPSYSTSEPTLEDWSEFTRQFMSSQRDTITGDPESQLKFYIMSYLLSAAFKDCSIIVCFDTQQDDPRVYVIDLDAKSAGRLEKWYNLDKDIALQFDGNGKSQCVDSSRL